ncbi:MAG TPA: tyrosine-type recombinase/integrase [Hyphomonadaceae bacterium]|nr:tyrosine-type recombinase/integrase [Hyphomonadaceae bacterium]
MLTDTALKNLKSKDKTYKIADRDGMYAQVKPTGTIVFRFDYRLHGRRETLTLGQYGRDGITLSEARERCIDARKAVKAGQSPAQEKQREKRRLSTARTFGEWGEQYFKEAKIAQSTKEMRRHIYDRDIAPTWKNRLLSEVAPDDLRALCSKVKERGAPATAIHVRDIVKQIFVFAILQGDKVLNPADSVAPSSIATFEIRDRALTPSEIRIAFRLIERVATMPTIRLGLKFILFTMVRKSELLEATWNEFDFENRVWSIPKERMKKSKPHNVYLSDQSIDILIALKTCAGNSRYLLPSRYDADEPMCRVVFNRVTAAIAKIARDDDLPLAPFTVHDLRRTASTLLNEVGFNSDWIEKCLAHEHGRTVRGVYNKAEYEPQRRHMLQQWSNMVEAWIKGEKYTATFMPPAIELVAHDPQA